MPAGTACGTPECKNTPVIRVEQKMSERYVRPEGILLIRRSLRPARRDMAHSSLVARVF
ncbi:MAG: hypothetical protein WEA04_04595 [Candidatus Andersenbacteria bacterium]